MQGQTQFIYKEIKLRQQLYQTLYTFEDHEAYHLMEILNSIGEEGWEFVGFFEGKYIAKKAVPAELED